MLFGYFVGSSVRHFHDPERRGGRGHLLLSHHQPPQDQGPRLQVHLEALREKE